MQMNPSHRQTPWPVISFLLLIGAVATVFEFWLIDNRQAIPNSGAVMAMLFGVFFISYTWALLKYLRWRDTERSMVVSIASSTAQSRPELEGTVYGMVPGREYRVMKAFEDCYGNSFERGEELRFERRHFLPYDGGHTIVFDKRLLYLQESRNKEILDNFSDYVEELKQI